MTWMSHDERGARFGKHSGLNYNSPGPTAPANGRGPVVADPLRSRSLLPSNLIFLANSRRGHGCGGHGYKMSYQSVIRSFVFTLCLSTASVAAAQVTITSPAAGQRLPAGPDYATDVLADPWDMSNVQDMSQDPNERGGFSALAFRAAA